MAVLLILSISAGCSSSKPAASGNAVTYQGQVKGIISNNCLTCHGSESPTLDEFKKDEDKYKAMMKGPRIDSYENLIVLVNGSDAGALMRRLDDGTNTKDGKPGNMYVNLGKTDEERANNLKTLKAWTGSWSLKKSNELTDEERRAIKAPEK